MDAGRELDAEVARAMGWYHEPDWADIESWWFDNPKFTGQPRELPRFSTDWAAAGKAWEWLKEIPRAIDTSVALSRSMDGKPAVWVLGLMESPRWIHIRYVIEGETYPHAIALAILENARIGEQR